MLGEAVPVLQFELFQTALLYRQQDDQPVRFGRVQHAGAEFFIDEDTLTAGPHASRKVTQSLVDERLRLAHPHQVRLGGRSGDAEDLLGKGGALVHGENEERFVGRR